MLICTVLVLSGLVLSGLVLPVPDVRRCTLAVLLSGEC